MEKIVENKNCKKCNSSFEITEMDLEFYEKISPVFSFPVNENEMNITNIQESNICSFEGTKDLGNGKIKYLIPCPTLCPNCRQQRRLSFRNERKLYRRKCDATGKDIISIYSPDKSYKVYDQDFWWSDTWNALDFGFEFDFNRDFFEQMNDLLNLVPKQSLVGANNINSAYCNLCADNKDCYLIFESSNNEECLYGYWLQKCLNCIDCSFMHQCELCFESLDCFDCYNSKYLFSCKDCTDSYFLEDCIGLKNCFGCVNLSNKEFYIFNKQFSKEKYFEKIKELEINNTMRTEFLEFSKKYPKKFLRILNSIDCLGNQIENSNNCLECFHSFDAENCKYSEHIWRNAKNCFDVSTAGRDAEYMFESINCGMSVYNFKYCAQCWGGSNLIYCMFNSNINECFGCVGLVNKQYCIFNKQYTKEQYEIIVQKIIKHMIKSGEWGEFFPSSISPFGYNETVANEYLPLTRECVIVSDMNQSRETFLNGQIFNWSDYEAPFPKVDKIIKADMLPSDISKIPDDILNWAIDSEITKKPFRIIAQELDFYRKYNLAIPKIHPDQRHMDRIFLRSQRELFTRNCNKCGIEIKTTYSNEDSEIVYCEKCYNNEMG